MTKPVIRITEAEAAKWREERIPPQQPTRSVGDRYFLRPAQEDGDWGALADYLDKGGEVTPAIRKFLAAILRREVPRKKGAPVRARTRTDQLEAAALVFMLKDTKIEDYIIQTARSIGHPDEAGERAVERAVDAWPEMNAEIALWVLTAVGRRQ